MNKQNLIRYKVDNCQNCKKHFISLHRHHINGDYTDNRQKNIMILCPRCHFFIQKKTKSKFKYNPIKICIRLTKTASNFLEDKNISPEALFHEALKELGYKA